MFMKALYDFFTRKKVRRELAREIARDFLNNMTDAEKRICNKCDVSHVEYAFYKARAHMEGLGGSGMSTYTGRTDSRGAKIVTGDTLRCIHGHHVEVFEEDGEFMVEGEHHEKRRLGVLELKNNWIKTENVEVIE